jgi:hypothetical protein
MTGGITNTQQSSFGARFSPLSIYQRYPTGRAWFWDDFENTFMNWGNVNAGAGTSQRITTDAFQGGASMQMLTTAAGADATEIFKRLPKMYKRVGVEFLWKQVSTGIGNQTATFEHGYENYGTHNYSAYFFYFYRVGVGLEARIQYQDQSGAFQTIIDLLNGQLPISAGIGQAWQSIKYVVDFSTFGAPTYEYYCLNGILVDMKHAPLFQWAGSGTENYMEEVFFWLKNGGVATAQQSLLDNVIVTMDEPDVNTFSIQTGLPIQQLGYIPPVQP